MIKGSKNKIISFLEKRFSFTKKIFLPGFMGQSLYETFQYLITGLKKNSIVDRAYAISYKFILASFPFVIFLFSIVPFIPIEGLQEEILRGILKSFPDQVVPYIQNFFEDLLLHKKSSILSIGFLLTIFFASNTMSAILMGFNSSYHLNRIKRKGVSIRLWSIALIFIIAILLILTTLIYILGGNFINYVQVHGGMKSSIYSFFFILLQWLTIFGLFVVAISILYNVGNTEKERWRIISPGIIFSTIFIGVFSQGFSWFIQYIAPYNKLYGSLGTIIIFLLFVYYFFAILLIGFELDLSVQAAQKKGSPEKAS